MKKRMAAFMCGVCVLANATAAMAFSQYDYEMKYLYDVKFDCLWADYPTFGELVGFQSSNDLNLDLFINSEWGEQTAKNFYTYVTYAKDPMNENLVAYWERQGLVKEAYLQEPEEGEETEEAETAQEETEAPVPDENGIIDDYYVYSPVGAKGQTETSYPCIIVNHGGGEPAYQAETFGYCQIAAREGIILIMAENEEPENLYNILQKVKTEYPIDESRIYATGSSMGAGQSITLAATYPTLLAAITQLDVAPKFVDQTENQEAFDAVKEAGIAVVNIAGLADKYGAYPLGVNEMNSVSGWNDLVTVTGNEDYCLTEEESAELAANSLNIAEHITGGKFEETSFLYPVNNKVMVNDFTNGDGINNLRVIVVDNKGHIPSGYDAEYSWEFMKHFSRSLETGELVYTE